MTALPQQETDKHVHFCNVVQRKYIPSHKDMSKRERKALWNEVSDQTSYCNSIRLVQSTKRKPKELRTQEDMNEWCLQGTLRGLEKESLLKDGIARERHQDDATESVLSAQEQLKSRVGDVDPDLLAQIAGCLSKKASEYAIMMGEADAYASRMQNEESLTIVGKSPSKRSVRNFFKKLARKTSQ